MIIFLYGSDTYRSRQKLNKIIAQYKEIHKSGLNLKYFDCININFQDFSNGIRQIPMFEEKKMFILTNSFSSSEFKEQFKKEGRYFVKSENIIVIHEEGQVLKRDPFFVFLKKQAKTQEFKLLKGVSLKNWVKKEFEEAGVKVKDRVSDKLIFFVGNNLWQMANEIKKLVSFKSGEEVEIKDIELLVKPNIESNIFQTIDAIASRDRKRALNLLKAHLEKGDSPLYLFSMINFQFRNLLIVKDLIERNLSPFDMTDLHPFVIKKSRFMARKFNISELKKIYQKIFKVDLAIKTGKIDPEAALELLIAEI